MNRLQPEQMLAAMNLSGLASARWFRHKLESAADGLHACVEDWAELPCPGVPQPLLMTVIRTGLGRRYFVPVGARARTEQGDTHALNSLGEPVPEVELFDAAASPDYVRAVMALIDAGATVACERGLLRFEPAQRAAVAVAAATAANATMAGWEVRPQGGAYSNSVVFAERRIVLKTFRGFAGGINPEAEIGQALAMAAGFSDTVPFLGHAVYEGPGGVMESMAVVTGEVTAVGDAWELTVESLSEAARNHGGGHESVASPRGGHAASAQGIDMEGLGRAIARLHAALASVDAPGFGRRQATGGDLTAWLEAYARQAEAAHNALEAYSARSGRRLSVPAAILTPPLSHYMNAGIPMGAVIRCHGDLHLGQALVKAGGGYAIIDFEGEPSAPIEARRAPSSPARDLAGMARSLSYARAVAERRGGGDCAAWERAARKGLFRGYEAESDELGMELMPPEPVSTALIAHFEAQKAMYELVYELNNRPDWVEIPLSGLSALSGAAGGEQA